MATLASPYKTADREKITVSTVVKQLTLAKRRARPTPERVVITLQPGGPLMWTADGTAPTTTLGHFATAGGFPVILDNRHDIEEFRAIRQGGADAVLEVAYQRA